VFTSRLSACEGDSIYVFGFGADTYNWSDGRTDNPVYFKTSGTYTVIGQDFNGCKDTSDNIVLGFYPLPVPEIRMDGGNAICQGSSVVLSTTTPYVTYTWPGAVTTPAFTVSQAGSYSVSVSDIHGCRGTSDPFDVVVSNKTPPTPSIIRIDTLCTGSTASLTADKEYKSYLWSNGDTSRVNTISFGGTYSLTVSDTNGCSGTSEYISVISHPKPFCNILSAGGFAFCDGKTDTLRTNISFSSYQWSTGATTQKIGVNSAGSYSVTVTDLNGCSKVSNPITETSHSNPVVTITAGGGTTFCNGKSVNLNASGAFNSYLWSNGNISPALIATQSGTYYVVATDQNHCKGTSNSIDVNVSPGPSVTIFPSDTTSFCEGNSVDLTSSGSFSAYKWSSGQTSANLNVTQTADYSLEVTDSNGCKGQSNSIDVHVFPVPTPGIISSNGFALCAGNNTNLGTTIPYTTYDWSNGQSTSGITVDQSGKYAVQVSDNNGCMGVSDSVDLIVSPQPVSDFSFMLSNQQATFTNNSLDATHFQWNFGDNSSADFSFNPVHTYTSSNNYLVSLIAFNNNCTDTSWKTLSIPTAYEENDETANVSVYPNPNKGEFYVQFPISKSFHGNIEIYNLKGEMVYYAGAKNDIVHLRLPENLKGVFFVKPEYINRYYRIIVE
jgi:hypothetical protein